MRGQSYSDWVSSCLEEPRDQVRFLTIMIVAVISVISGLFIVLPCIESYKKVDLRTITLGVPPQEVFFPSFLIFFLTQLWFVFSCWPRTASPCQGRSHLIELSSKIKNKKQMRNIIKLTIEHCQPPLIEKVLKWLLPSVDAVVYYRVSNAIVSVTNVKDTHHSTKYISQGSTSFHLTLLIVGCWHKLRSEISWAQKTYTKF